MPRRPGSTADPARKASRYYAILPVVPVRYEGETDRVRHTLQEAAVSGSTELPGKKLKRPAKAARVAAAAKKPKAARVEPRARTEQEVRLEGSAAAGVRPVERRQPAERAPVERQPIEQPVERRPIERIPVEREPEREPERQPERHCRGDDRRWPFQHHDAASGARVPHGTE